MKAPSSAADSVFHANRSAGAAFAADGASMKWIASCSTGLASSPGLRVLAPESDDACFGYPHSVVPINRTHVMLIDDGSDRAGCTKDVTGGGFSRAICYERNKKTRTARGAVRRRTAPRGLRHGARTPRRSRPRSAARARSGRCRGSG